MVEGAKCRKDSHATNSRISRGIARDAVPGLHPMNRQNAFQPVVYAFFVFGAIEIPNKRLISSITTLRKGLVMESYGARHVGLCCETVPSESGTKRRLAHYVHQAHARP